MERLLDAYLTGSFTKSILDERGARLKAVTDSLELERADLAARLSVHQVTEEDIDDLRTFGQMVGQKLSELDEDFVFRVFVINGLDVRATLSVEDGQQVVCVGCLGRPRNPYAST